MKKTLLGFSLLELAIIVLLLGLLTTLTWKFIGQRVQQQAAVKTYSLLERADWALTGFIMSHHRLPCPDTNQDGEENCGGSDQVGTLPYKTLGLADARAGQIRYGVLRRTEVVADPEADLAVDPAPPLPRAADLTVATDRFYPLLAGIGHSGGGFQSTLPDLTTSTGLSGRVYRGVQAYNAELGEQNGLDFCWALRVAEDPLPGNDAISQNVHVLVNGQPRQVAYALALPGALNMDDDNNLFDGAQVSALAFNAPQQAQTYLNDDRVRAVSPGVLWDRHKCGEAMASIGHAQANTATAAVILYHGLYDYEQVLEQSVALASSQITIASAGVVSAVAMIIDAVAGAFHAAGDMAKLFGVAAWSIAAAVLMAASAAITMPVAILALVSAVEIWRMTEQRYHFVMGLRGSAKGFAEELLLHVKTADERGLYMGRP
ncbi:MAG: hypothetical protein LBE75_09415 [Burkholderiales bacterium]|jgi:hypothetical protein|nr:hypothetical protein [Burkholderiales bacterium]